MRLLRVGTGETVSIRGVISLAFRNSVSFCNPASNPTRVSCFAALGWNGAPEAMFCCGELMFFVGNCHCWVRLTTLSWLVPRLWDCASANGIAQMARSESSMSALRRRCALTEGLICFFNVVSSCACSGCARLSASENSYDFSGLCFHHRDRRGHGEKKRGHRLTQIVTDNLVNFSARICVNPRQAPIGEGCCAICGQSISASFVVRG